jgi:hypothetical protein
LEAFILQIKKSIFLTGILITFYLFSSCSDGKSEFGDNEFQLNSLSSSNFVVTDIFEGEGALEETWDSIDGKIFDDKLTYVVNNNIDEFVTFSYCFSDIFQDESRVMPTLLGTDVKNTVAWLIDTDIQYKKDEKTNSFYTESGSDYAQGFYSLLDKLSEDDETDTDVDTHVIVYNILNRFIDNNTPLEINDPDFQNDFIDVSELIGKPMWIDNNETLVDYDNINTGCANSWWLWGNKRV